MSIPEYQRAMADLVRSPAFCGAVRSSERPLAAYALTEIERQRLQQVARSRGMRPTCMLYRASRLVGITRRLPSTVVLLWPVFREVFDAFIEECVDAPAEFDREAQAFARFLKPRLGDLAARGAIDPGAILATLVAEEAAMDDAQDAT
jgi:hypothetical protein